MGFFDKLFGGKTEQEETVKFFGQSKTVLTPIRGKVLAQADIPDETFAQGILGPVSYTHLDVYKRQALRRIPACRLSTESSATRPACPADGIPARNRPAPSASI